MNTIALAIFIFLDIMIYLIILDVILSWLTIFGVRFRPRFLANIMDPMYNYIKNIITTNIGPFELTPIILFLLIGFLKGIVLIMFPEIEITINSLR